MCVFWGGMSRAVEVNKKKSHSAELSEVTERATSLKEMETLFFPPPLKCHYTKRWG